MKRILFVAGFAAAALFGLKQAPAAQEAPQTTAPVLAPAASAVPAGIPSLDDALARLRSAGGLSDEARQELLAQMHPVDGGWSVSNEPFDKVSGNAKLELRNLGAVLSALASGGDEVAQALAAGTPKLPGVLEAKISQVGGSYQPEYYRFKLSGRTGAPIGEVEFLRPDGPWAKFMPILADMGASILAFGDTLDGVKDSASAAAALNAYAKRMDDLFRLYESTSAQFQGDELGVPPVAVQQAAQELGQKGRALTEKFVQLKPYAGDEAVVAAANKVDALQMGFHENLGRALGLPGSEADGASGGVAEGDAGLPGPDDGAAQESVPLDPNKDYSPLASLFEEFVDVSSRFADSADAADDEAGLASALESFAEGIAPLYVRMKNILVDYPELARSPEPPAVVKAVFDKLNGISPRVQAGIAKAQAYPDNEQIKTALSKLFALGS